MKTTESIWIAAILVAACLGGASALGAASPGTLPLNLRRLVESAPGSGDWRETNTASSWDARNSAVVICDMWNQHWCQGATARVAEMAPRMNAVISALRERGVLIIHCPSDTMDYYKGHPGRLLALSAPKVATPKPLDWVSRVAGSEPPLPIDDSDGGCDDQPRCAQASPWRHEISTLEIKDGDAITDGPEAYYLMRQRGVTNVIVMGVHENMCVLGRPFSIRQMVRQGQNVVLMRDLTDTMYNSRSKPYVSHYAGTELVCRHIEKYWCATVTSDQILGGEPFRFAADSKSRP